MIDEKDLDQPWVPEGAWIPKIGERVRIRLGDEAGIKFNLWAGEFSTNEWVERPNEVNGQIGTVTEFVREKNCYIVAFISPIPYRDGLLEEVGFFPNELEPVDTTR